MTLSWLNGIPPFFAAILSLIAAASVLIKALEGCVSILTTVFPKLKGVDGKLSGIARILDAASKSKILNTIAASPSAAFHASLNPPGVDTTTQAHAVIQNVAPPVPVAQPKGYVTPAAALFGVALAGALLYLGTR